MDPAEAEEKGKRPPGGVLDQIGDTPLVKIANLASADGPDLYAKLEFFNPSGSIKDRVALHILRNSERSGILEPGRLIVESTSGNMGLSFAMAGAVKGYRCVFAVPESISREKTRALELFGAEVVLTPRGLPPSDERSCYKVAQRIARERNGLYINQYFNDLNPGAHYASTGPEIWEQTGGRVGAVFCGMGTGGTISGVGKYLKEKNPAVRIIGVEPAGSVFRSYFAEGVLTQAGNFQVEGIGKNFIPGVLDFEYVDDVIQINDRRSYGTVSDLIREEGIFAGGSGGAVVAAALDYRRRLDESLCAVAILPDTGFKYLSKLAAD